jgi:hypothetical protein
MATRKRCKPCKSCTRHKRKGSPRFTKACKLKFRACQKETLKETGSMRAAGQTCIPALHECMGHRTQKAAVRKYKRARAA